MDSTLTSVLAALSGSVIGVVLAYPLASTYPFPVSHATINNLQESLACLAPALTGICNFRRCLRIATITPSDAKVFTDGSTTSGLERPHAVAN